jgi:putative mRNA 3-end processing factor
MPVDRAVVTHAHSDHARPGHAHYLAQRDSEGILRKRLAASIALQSVDYGEVVEHQGVRVSLHPAGHVLGSAQVRLEHGGRRGRQPRQPASPAARGRHMARVPTPR